MKTYLMIWIAALAITGCGEQQLIVNAEIDSWCGDTPCGWEVDGEISRASTWHSHDYAAELVSNDARLHQANDQADGSIRCFGFSMLAKVEGDAKAYVELDFLDDGEIDWSKRIPASDYEPVSFHVTPPTWFEGVRFIVRKEGPGKVVLARLRAYGSSGGGDDLDCTAEPVDLDGRPSNAACESDDQCVSGECTSDGCAGCLTDGDCGDDHVCGYAITSRYFGEPLDVGPSCIPAGSVATGALCRGDGECESGICCEGVCSECCGEGPSNACPNERVCAPSDVRVDDPLVILPHQCAPGAGLAESGAFCTADDDCESSSCGELECVGLCSEIYEEHDTCAKRACDGSDCDDFTCEIVTVNVGRCL